MTVELYNEDHEALAARVGQVDVLITDPPFSERTHRGQKAKRHDGSQGVATHGLSFDHWTEQDVSTFVQTWSPLVRRWMVIMCSHDLIPLYEQALIATGRYVFAPLPVVIRGMSVRLAGDGPSSWSFYIVVARPVGMKPLSGTLPGAYVGTQERGKPIPSCKPLWLMRALVSDYARVEDLIVDPCAGSGTTLIAACTEGHRVIGAEPHAERFAIAQARLLGNHNPLQQEKWADHV